MAATPALAQTSAAAAPVAEASEVVVTGTRIRQAALTDRRRSRSLLVIDAQDLTDRGFVQAGQLINDLTSIIPTLPKRSPPALAARRATASTFPNLFNLGPEAHAHPGRRPPLCQHLVDAGHPAAAVGRPAPSVDTNLIYIGLESTMWTWCRRAARPSMAPTPSPAS